MNELKSPAMLVSVLDAVAIGGLAYYYQKQFEEIRSNMLKINQTLSGVVRKLAEMEQNEKGRADVFKELGEHVTDLDNQLRNVPLDKLDLVAEDIKEVAAVLSEHQIPVELPSEKSEYSPERKPSGRNSRRDDPRAEYGRRPTTRSSRDFEPRHGDRRNIGIKQPERRKPEPARSEIDDDAALIGAVRGVAPPQGNLL